MPVLSGKRRVGLLVGVLWLGVSGGAGAQDCRVSPGGPNPTESGARLDNSAKLERGEISTGLASALAGPPPSPTDCLCVPAKVVPQGNPVSLENVGAQQAPSAHELQNRAHACHLKPAVWWLQEKTLDARSLEVARWRVGGRLDGR